MADRHLPPAHLPPALSAVIARLTAWRHAGSIEAEPIAGGLTNTNYLVTVDGERFVVRVVGSNSAALGIDRRREREIARRAAAAGIGAEVVAYLLPEGHSVTRFIEGRTFDRAGLTEPETLRRAVATLERVHQLAPIAGAFNPFTDIRHRLQQLEGRDTAVPDDMNARLDRVWHIEATSRQTTRSPVLCHNDPYYTNFIDDGGRDLRLLDWEYAGMGDALYDLAAVAYALDPAGRRLLLDAYFGEASDDMWKTLTEQVYVFLMWNAVWALVQITDSKVDHDYADMARWFFGLMDNEG